MANGIRDELNQLSPAQRTMFATLKRRFGARLGLSDAVLLHTVRRMFVPPHYRTRKNILRAGDFLDLFTILGSGAVRITCRDTRGRTLTLQIIGDGHAFGLPSLARKAEAPRFGAEAHSLSLVAFLTRDALEDIITQLDVQRRLRLLTYGWNASVGLLLEKRLLRSLPIADRIWCVLARLAERFPAAAREAGTIGLRLTQTEIGQLIGATRSTVCRQLRWLGRDIVSRRRGRYVVHRQPALPTATDHPRRTPTGAPVNDDVARREMLHRLRQSGPRVGLPLSAVQAFGQHARLILCPPGTQIALPDCSEALAFLVSGAVRVECPGPADEPLTLFFAKPPWLIVGGVPPHDRIRFYTVAHVESYAAVVTRNGLAHVIAAMSASEFLRLLVFNWRALAEHSWRTCLQLTMTTDERVWWLLGQLARDFGARHDAGTIIDLPLTRTDLARLAGTNEARIGSCLARLEGDGRIAFANGSFNRIVVTGLCANPQAA